MKLTPELIASCPSYLNPLKDRQLDLRGEIGRVLVLLDLPIILRPLGHKIPAIENLGVTKVCTPATASSVPKDY